MFQPVQNVLGASEHWARIVQTDRGKASAPAPPRTGGGGALETPCQRHVRTRFGFTRAKNYVDLGAFFKRKLGGRLTKEKLEKADEVHYGTGGIRRARVISG